MKARSRESGIDRSPSRQIDDMIRGTRDWRGPMLSRLRGVILRADPTIVEEVKWKKPSNPEGVPVWSRDGILCIANTLKAAVRLTFSDGARIRDPTKLFNARFDSKTVRAIDFHEGDGVDEKALIAIVREAVAANTSTRG